MTDIIINDKENFDYPLGRTVNIHSNYCDPLGYSISFKSIKRLKTYDFNFSTQVNGETMSIDLKYLSKEDMSELKSQLDQIVTKLEKKNK